MLFGWQFKFSSDTENSPPHYEMSVKKKMLNRQRRIKDRKQTFLQVMALPYEVLYTADRHLVWYFVYSHCELFRPCLFWAEFLCSFPLCCPHTLWRVASCCLISCPSDTHVPSAHQGVHSQQRERSPCSSSFFLPPFLPPSLCVPAKLKCPHNAG